MLICMGFWLERELQVLYDFTLIFKYSVGITFINETVSNGVIAVAGKVPLWLISLFISFCLDMWKYISRTL